MKHTTLSLTVDVEGEWFGLPSEQGTFDVLEIVSAVEHLERLLNRFEHRIETRIPVTWFIRCDDSVAVTTGETSGLLQALDGFIVRRSALGDEFGMHPHLYSLSQGKWGPEVNPDEQAVQIERAGMAWKSYFGSAPKLSRMGEAVMNNAIASSLDSMGIEIDSSALSGRRRFDNGFQFDWLNTPALPYRPSLEDYRRPALGAEPAHRFIEVPFSMLAIKGPHDEQPISRYLNLAFRPALISAALGRTEKSGALIAVIHPHELMVNSRRHPLIAHSPSSLEENLSSIAANYESLKFSLLSACANGYVK